MRESTSSRSCSQSAQPQLVTTKRLFAFVRRRSKGATCCSRCSAGGGPTSSVFDLTAVTTTSSSASTRADAPGHKLFRMAAGDAAELDVEHDAIELRMLCVREKRLRGGIRDRLHARRAQ